ncbi:MAG: class I SAM-dependent methyltransferase [Micropepsaceae bacterium]
MPNKDVFDEYAGSYSEAIDKSLGQFGVEHDFFTKHKAFLIDEILTRTGRSAATMSLLDVGCGVGAIHSLIEGKFKAIAGVDVSDDSLRVAKQEHGQIDYKSFDGQHLPFADGSFDMTMAICVFHHVPPAQQQQLANEMVRIVRDQGLILIIEHNRFNPVTQYIVNTCPIDKDAILLSQRRLRRLFEMPMTSYVKSRSVLNVPPVTNALKRLDAMLGRVPIGAQYYMTAVKSDQAQAG